jgi:isoleucyl-tRNA synthetase
MYPEFKHLNLPEIDAEVRCFWEEHNIFQKSVDQRPAVDSFVFYEGPPSANGKPGIHHVMARTVKDLFCRYHTLSGRRVERKGGWDTHGLPVELQVEKELGITKEDIGKTISVDAYNKACRDTVLRYKDLWDDLTRKMGYWVDLDAPYITFDNHYIETCWWLIQRLYQSRTPDGERLLYKGFTIQPFSPAAGTGLSSHELNMPGCYKEVTDTSAVAMFKVLNEPRSAFLFDQPDEDVRILAWTTTPWTLPSNVALTVGPGITYAKVRTFSPYTALPVSVILAEDRIAAYFGQGHDELPMEPHDPQAKKPAIPFRIITRMKGSELVGLRYEQLLPMPHLMRDELARDGFRVIEGDFVTTEDGTGVVHTAPFFGADDFRVCQQAGIPFIGIPDDKGRMLPLVDRQGKFVEEVPEFGGRFVKAEYYPEAEQTDPDFKPTDLLIALRLKADNKAFRIEKYKHPYPHCWRTDKPILYYPLDSWFIRASAARERMAQLNHTITWKPASTGTGRFGQWLDNLQDWNLSRSRYWGVPLPIWRTDDGSEEVCVGSMEELRRLSGKPVPEDIHRPYIDEVTLTAPSGKPMYREPDLIDVWFDSGAMPYAQWGLDPSKVEAGHPLPFLAPFEHMFPADFIAEGVDQTRGWFYTLHAIATMCFDSVAYKTVVSNGLVLDKNGEKMSKSKGNVVDPFSTLSEFGADATRWYMIANANPWDNLKFDTGGIIEVRNKFFGTLFNTYNFFATYANVDGWSADRAEPVPLQQRSELDRWIISRLNSLVADYRAAMDDYEPTRAARAVELFVDEHLSNWYIRLSRRRFWKGALNADKNAAYLTLFECLVTTAQLSASLAPFFTDWLYRNLRAGASNTLPHESVHLTDLPELRAERSDKTLEKRMDYAQRICSLALSLRKQDRLRVRLPLRNMLLPVLDEAFIREVDGVKDLILAETNVKALEYVTDASGLLHKAAKANFKTLGARLGKDMKAVADQIGAFTNEDINALERSGSASLSANGNTYTIEPADIIVTTEDLPGWKVATDGPLTVALDVQLDDLLLDEGMARDLVNKIQNLRKEQALNVTDRVTITLEKHPAILSAVERFKDYIQSEVLAVELILQEQPNAQEVALNDDLSLRIGVTPVRG